MKIGIAAVLSSPYLGCYSQSRSDFWGVFWCVDSLTVAHIHTSTHQLRLTSCRLNQIGASQDEKSVSDIQFR